MRLSAFDTKFEVVSPVSDMITKTFPVALDNLGRYNMPILSLQGKCRAIFVAVVCRPRDFEQNLDP